MSLSFGPGSYRFLLATLVVVHHTTSLGLGSAAVYSFFTLSGYWMHTVWVQKYSRAANGYRALISARLLRLLPMFWLISLFGCAVDYQLGRLPLPLPFQLGSWREIAHIFVSNTVLLGYNTLSYQAVGTAWSLDVELQFYLLLPLIAFVVKRFEALGGAVLGVCALFLPGTWLRESFFAYGIFFYFGAVAANRRWVPSDRQAMWAVCLVGILLVLTICSGEFRSILLGGSRQTQMYRDWNQFFNAALSVLLVPLTVWTAARKSDAFDRMLGDMSYGVYLIHAPMVLYYSAFYGRLPIAERLPYLFSLFALVFVASWLVWRFFDRPLLNVRDDFLRKTGVQRAL